MQLWTPSHIMVALSGLLDRLEKRYCLKGITMFEYMGHQHDARLLKQCLEIDFVDYRCCPEVFDLVRDVSKRIVKTDFELTTCKLQNTTYVARKNEVEEKEDLEKLGVATLLNYPIPTNDPQICIVDGKLRYNVSESLR